MSQPSIPSAQPASTGISGMDDILGGGFTTDRLYLVEGDPGAGKTTLAMQYLLEGARRGEAGQASDGRQAVELVERLRPDVVVMDVTMPVLSGVEATRQITERWPTVRVVALSMHDQSDMAAAMREAGAAAYVTKGGPAGALIDCIRGSVATEDP